MRYEAELNRRGAPMRLISDVLTGVARARREGAATPFRAL
jgi:hypothetical protein